MAHRRAHPDEPWMPRGAVDLLDQLLTEVDCGVEWGAGRSTCWIGERVGRLLSIEHDDSWHRFVTSNIEQAGLTSKVTCVLRELGTVNSRSAPYVAAASDLLEPASLDFAIVDGQSREACVLAAIPLLKNGGLLVIDNIERYLGLPTSPRTPAVRDIRNGFRSEAWQEIYSVLEHWPKLRASDNITETLFTFKRAA